ncbi:MAG TPA: hypothetical protein VK874_10275 [Gaiellaceae bacterium]|nr:hypothetical protein [Gaiellaceae bacterium]
MTNARTRIRAWRAGVALLVAASTALAVPAQARADLDDERALAERHAPVVRLVEQEEECGPGEPYEPMDVDALFDEPTVALRGPWNAVDLVEIGPGADDVAGLYEYHLDFPGSALSPGCGYERWARLITEETRPAVYAHVAEDAARPGSLALQYWFFYAFNDFNNLHEGDWEMVQLVFEAPDARAALDADPVEVGYTSHEGAERAAWDADKLELVDGTHPVVYPAAGSHANKYTEALYLGSSAEAGVGCDDTRGPHVELRPVVKVIPSDREAAERAFPWIAFEGRWGELQKAFFNGPTGPNMKTQWNEPIEWAEGWRDRSYAVPTGGVFGTGATDFFCSAVETGSRGLVGLLRNPGLTLLVLGALLALLIYAATRTTWRPTAPFRVARRRTWGQILSAAGRMYIERPSLFLGIGALLIPLAVVVSVLQVLVLGGFGLLGIDATGETAGALVLLVVAVGTTLALLGLAVVQAATASALVEIDAGRRVGPMHAYRLALARLRSLVGALAIGVAVWVALNTTAVLLPVAVWLAVRWSLLAPAVAIEAASPVGALRRSSELVRGRWLRVASLVGAGAVVALVAGPLLGALLIFLTDAPLALLNVVAGVVYALAMPFVALTTAYVYVDARVRDELAVEAVRGQLPAEIELGDAARP